LNCWPPRQGGAVARLGALGQARKWRCPEGDSSGRKPRCCGCVRRSGRSQSIFRFDLQDLNNPDRAEYIWQLTLRPIDRAVRAMPPLADRIGAPAARFAAIMREGRFAGRLGKTPFEAYPAGTLKMLKVKAGSYKGASGVLALRSLCGMLNVEPHVDSDDDFDAIICAITAAAPADAVHDGKALGVQGQMPKGFRIPKSLSFDRIETGEARFDAWMAMRGGVA
jgi:hypothetical protein